MIRRSLFTRMASVAVASIVCITSSASAEAPLDIATVGHPGNTADQLNSVAIPGIGAPTEAGQSEDVFPEGLTGSDWSSIRQAYERHRHAVVAVDGEFRARNPGQQWMTHFDGRGFTVQPSGADWRWGLELQSYGFPGHQRAVGGQATMTAQNDRMTYDWDAGLREWFVNDRRGLEHGFTLVSRPPGASDPQLGTGQWLELRLAVRGGLRAQAHADGLGVSFVNEQGSTVVNYAGLKVWDADNRVLTARIHADARGLRLSVDERGARYPLTIDPIAQQAYLKASNSDGGLFPSDQFGTSVAVSGDTVVVGAFGESSNATGVNGNQADNSATQSGAAYVFVKGGGGVWSQQAYLKASNTGGRDQFGRSVAVSGDTVVVGAYREDSNAAGVNGNQVDNSAGDSGAAYVFVRDGGGVWSQQAYLKASNTDANDEFGYSVSMSGDTVVVGAWLEGSNAAGVDGNQDNNSALSSGAAYVFVREGGGVWSQQAYLKASNTGAGDGFGRSVAVSGDTVVVGAQFEDSNATGVNGNQADNSAVQAGAAYVFLIPPSGPTCGFSDADADGIQDGVDQFPDTFSNLAVDGSTTPTTFINIARRGDHVLCASDATAPDGIRVESLSGGPVPAILQLLCFGGRADIEFDVLSAGTCVTATCLPGPLAQFRNDCSAPAASGSSAGATGQPAALGDVNVRLLSDGLVAGSLTLPEGDEITYDPQTLDVTAPPSNTTTLTVVTQSGDPLTLPPGDTVTLPTPTAVPTVSQWGLAAMVMLILCAGSIVLGKRTRGTA